MSAAVTDAELDGLIASLEGVRFLAHHGWAIPVRHHRNIRQHCRRGGRLVRDVEGP